jgi:hypothetical protein
MRDKLVVVLLSVLAVGALSLGGCATPSVFVPTQAASPESGYLVARYSVPPEAPQGEVLVTSYGVTKLEVAPKTSMPMLHIRIGLSNTRGPIPWTLDAREQLATVAGRGPLPPTYANSDAGGPVATAQSGQNRVLDLYYPLAPGEERQRDVPYFEINWKVHAGDRVVAQRTPFQRAEVPVADYGYGYGYYGYPAYFAVGLGWSPFWWYDPFWPYPVPTVGFPVAVRPHVGPYRVVGGPVRYQAGTSWRGTPVGPGAGAVHTAPSGGWHGTPVHR